MSTTEAKFHDQSSPLKTQKFFFAAQICLRIFATATTLTTTWVVLTSKQTTQIFGMNFDARYSYSPPFKFFAYVNAVVCAFSLFSLFLILFLRRLYSNPSNYYFFFLHDLLMLCFVIGGCGAATATGYVGKYGNSHTGWAPICDHFATFCSRVSISVILSYFSMFFYLILTIISSSKARQIQVN